ncbi:hypothetical protein [Bradyrhizobium macuxiense]|uniref:hypothetical protein n=1 Tax=Bradyrhizobium macuxiense TaxID=1755647 RepID=UPI000AA36049|nr:hypothetical protein [Bradyrhizobium macuxiense]
MKIIATHAPLGADLALADVEIMPGVKMFGVRITRAHDGSYRAFARGAAFDREMVKTIATMILGECRYASAI